MRRGWMMAACLLAACDEVKEPEAVIADEEVIEVPPIGISDDAIGAELARAGQITRKEGAIKEEQAEFLELARQFEQRTGRKLSGVQLSREQAAMLQTMLSREQDVGMQGLLQEILDTRAQIAGLQSEIDALKAQLPQPSIVARGDTHLGLATSFLTNQHGLSADEAKKLAERSLLTNELAPGMEVWHFYADGVYASAVTQGTAKFSPYFLNTRAMRKVKRERDEAVALARSLEAEITVLEATRDELRTDLARVSTERDQARQERDDLEVRAEVLRADRDSLVTSNESAWYHIDSARNLRDADVLAPNGLRLKEWKKELFDRSIDLREDTHIDVWAQDFGVPRIRKLVLLPQERWREGTDYSVRIDEDGRHAVVFLDNIGKFKDDAFVVALR